MITYFYRVSMRPLALTDRSIGLNRVCFFDRVAHGTRSTRVTELYRVFTEFFLSRVAFDRFFRLACVGLVIFVGFFFCYRVYFLPVLILCRVALSSSSSSPSPGNANGARWLAAGVLVVDQSRCAFSARPSVRGKSLGRIDVDRISNRPPPLCFINKKTRMIRLQRYRFLWTSMAGCPVGRKWTKFQRKGRFLFWKKRQLGRSIFRSGFDSEVPLLCVFFVVVVCCVSLFFFFYLSGAESQARTKSSCRRFWMRPCGRRWRACRLPTTASRTRSDSVRNRSDPIKLGKARKKRCNFTMSRSLKVLPRDHVDVSTR